MENKASKYIFIVLIFLCSALIVVSSIRTTMMEPVRNAIGFILVPVQRGVNSIGVRIYDSLARGEEQKNALARNEEYKKKLDELTEENNRLKSEVLELERLRKLYELDTQYQQYPKVAARVIAKDSENWFQVFRIDKGAEDGIEKNMNVLSGGGLCGIVTDVGANYATVRAITDDESYVSAMSRHSSDLCIVNGDLTLMEDGLLSVTNFYKTAMVNEGDAIITSNISTKYLPGILIGYLSEVGVSKQQLTKTGKLIPAADFENLREVLVITVLKKDADLQDSATGE